MKIQREELIILDRRTGRIDLQRTNIDYLDIRDKLQSKLSFPVNHETHVKPLVKTAYDMLLESQKESDGIDCVLNLECGQQYFFFTFGVDPQIRSLTVND